MQKEIEELLALARRHHYSCEEDPWYNCPAHPDGCADDRQPAGVCNCGAEAHNKRVEALAEVLQAAEFKEQREAEPATRWFEQGEACEYELYPDTWVACEIVRVLVKTGWGTRYEVRSVSATGLPHVRAVNGYSLRKKDGIAARRARGEAV